MTMAEIAVYVGIVSPVFTATGVVVAIWVLRENHLWNRRQEAAKLLVSWTDKTSKHREGIEKLRPGLLDLIAGKEQEITRADAKAIYESAPDTEQWQMRFHIIELLNVIEIVAVAYENHIVDRTIVDRTLKPLLMRYYGVLHNYIDFVSKQRSYNPWKPYSSLIDQWKWQQPPNIRASGQFFSRP